MVRSELLQAAASRTMLQMVQALFARLASFPPSTMDEADEEGRVEGEGMSTQGTIVVPDDDGDEGRARRETKWKAKEGESREDDEEGEREVRSERKWRTKIHIRGNGSVRACLIAA